MAGLPKAFLRADGREIRDLAARIFIEHFVEFGCRVAPAVPVTSGVDPSVLFVGSAISVLKPLVLDQYVPLQGVALAQPVFRAHNAGRLLDRGFEFQWGGLFTNLAMVASSDLASPLLEHTAALFTHKYGFLPCDVRISVAAGDRDLVDLCQGLTGGYELAIDDSDPDTYRHGIGVDGVRGRNINIGLRHRRSGGFRYSGNFILFLDESTGSTFIEVGFGDTNILLARYDLEHVLDCFPFPDLPGAAKRELRALEDAVAVTLTLWREGLRPSSRDSMAKILGKYVRAVHHLARCAEMGFEHLAAFMSRYERVAHGGCGAAPDVVDYLRENSRRISARLGRP